jgi:hypothetical protein
MKISEAVLSLSLACITLPSLGQEAVLQGTIRDESTGQPSACTVAITDANGKLVTETESLKVGFRCEGQFTKKLPAGRTRIRITRGFETKFAEQGNRSQAWEQQRDDIRSEKGLRPSKTRLVRGRQSRAYASW